MYPPISELWGFSQCQAGLRCSSSTAKYPVFPFHLGLNSRIKCVYIGFKVSWLSSVYLACVQSSPQFLLGPQVYCTAACLQSYPQSLVTGKLTACGVQSTGSEEVGTLHVRKESGHAVRMWLTEPFFNNQTWLTGTFTKTLRGQVRCLNWSSDSPWSESWVFHKYIFKAEWKIILFSHMTHFPGQVLKKKSICLIRKIIQVLKNNWKVQKILRRKKVHIFLSHRDNLHYQFSNFSSIYSMHVYLVSEGWYL